jgi:hypothetical protein
MAYADYPCPRCKKPLKPNGHTPSGKQRWICRTSEAGGGRQAKRFVCYTTTNPKAKARDRGASREVPIFQRELRKVRRFIVTAAQNATPVHANFWSSLLQAAKHLKAELLVIPLRYKNPTSRWTESQENDETWAPELQPYLWNQRAKLNKNLVVLGDVKVQPTAPEPLSGFEAMTSGESCIIGHTALHLKSVPTPTHKMSKLITTTGAVTVANYTDSRAGKKGEFHHTLGAALVELDGPMFHLRQLNARSNGEFTDLDTTYTPTGHRQAARPLALIMGDTHVDFIDPLVTTATFGAQGLVATLRPEHLIWHDLLDGYAVNPHHFGNPFNALAKRATGRDNIRAEVTRATNFVLRHTPAFAKSVIVPSNHDDFLRRWIINTDWRMDPTNAEFYLVTALRMVHETKLTSKGTEYPSPFAYWAEMAGLTCLKTDESFALGGVELGMHGDRGPNGARGSIKNLRRIGLRSIIGHTHSPGISEGCYQTGTSTGLRLEYVSGPSSWLNTHCILHRDGKRQLITIINGKWRI